MQTTIDIVQKVAGAMILQNQRVPAAVNTPAASPREIPAQDARLWGEAARNLARLLQNRVKAKGDGNAGKNAEASGVDIGKKKKRTASRSVTMPRQLFTRAFGDHHVFGKGGFHVVLKTEEELHAAIKAAGCNVDSLKDGSDSVQDQQWHAVSNSICPYGAIAMPSRNMMLQGWTSKEQTELNNVSCLQVQVSSCSQMQFCCASGARRNG